MKSKNWFNVLFATKQASTFPKGRAYLRPSALRLCASRHDVPKTQKVIKSKCFQTIFLKLDKDTLKKPSTFFLLFSCANQNQLWRDIPTTDHYHQVARNNVKLRYIYGYCQRGLIVTSFIRCIVCMHVQLLFSLCLSHLPPFAIFLN